MVLTETLTVEKLLSKIERIAERLHGFTNKLVFSYVDIASYRKVRTNLLASGIPYREWDEDLMNQFAYGLFVHIPADTRSAFPVISVHSPVSIQCRWQS